MQSTSFRACEACRALKVRCESIGDAASAAQLPVSERPPCRRCFETGHPCVYTAPRRTRRKRTDVRVRELEKEVQQLAELLLMRGAGQQQDRVSGERMPSAQDSPVAWATPLQPTVPGVSPNVPSPAPFSPANATAPLAAATPPFDFSATPPAQPVAPPPSPNAADPVSAGLLSMAHAVRLFHRYVSIMAPQRPLVVFPSVTFSSADSISKASSASIAAVAAQVRAKTPVLFLSILTAAAETGLEDSNDDAENNDALATSLDALLLRIYAHRIMFEGDKSIELVQALLISSNWNFYYPLPSPSTSSEGADGANDGVSNRGDFDKLRFYQHLHLAASMAIELGLPMLENIQQRSSENPLVFERTLLACYCCCSSISLGFHKQILLPFNPNMAKCLSTLETSPDAAPTDANLAAWVRLQCIVDSASNALGLRATACNDSCDGPGLNENHEKVFTLDNPQTQACLQTTTVQLEQWKKGGASTYINNTILMQYNTVLCLLHESCFYGEFDPSDFKPPYRLSMPPPSDKQPKPLTPFHLASRKICLISARSTIGLFLAARTDQLLGGSAVVYARVGYAILILIKLQLSAALPGGAMHGHILDKAGTLDSVTQIYQYLGRIKERLIELESYSCRFAIVWLSIINSVYEWYESYLLPAVDKVPSKDHNDCSTRHGSGDATAGSVLELLRFRVSADRHWRPEVPSADFQPLDPMLASAPAQASTPTSSLSARDLLSNTSLFNYTAAGLGDMLGQNGALSLSGVTPSADITFQPTGPGPIPQTEDELWLTLAESGDLDRWQEATNMELRDVQQYFLDLSNGGF